MALAVQRERLGAIALVVLATGCGSRTLNAVTVDPQSLATDLVAHWTFDETSGAVAGDHSGNGHDGQLTGGTWISAGQFGGALSLGLGDYVTVPNFPQATPNWTVSVWTRASQAQLALDMNDTGTILSTEMVFAGGWQLHLDNRPAYQYFDAAYWSGSSVTDYVVVDCQCIAADLWVHLTAVFDDDAGQLTLYQNDVVVERKGLPSPIHPGDSTLYMGRWNMAQRFLAADLDDFAIWSRALSADEIAVLSGQTP